jgi:hypothetical protein
MTKLAEPKRLGVMTDKRVSPRLGPAGLTPASANVVTLTEEDCWALLQTHNLGRLAIVIDARPRISP